MDSGSTVGDVQVRAVIFNVHHKAQAIFKNSHIQASKKKEHCGNRPSVDVFNTSNYRHKPQSSIISVLHLHLHLKALTNHCRADDWTQNRQQKPHCPAPGQQVLTCIILQEWLWADHTDLTHSRRWDELYQLPQKSQNLGNAPPETRDTPNMKHSIKSAKHWAFATAWPQGLCLPVTILNSHSLTSSWYFPAPNPKAWAHSLFANKMGGIKKNKNKRDKEEIFDCSLHQLFWRIKAAKAFCLRWKVFLKYQEISGAQGLKQGSTTPHMKADLFRETIRQGGTN